MGNAFTNTSKSNTETKGSQEGTTDTQNHLWDNAGLQNFLSNYNQQFSPGNISTVNPGLNQWQIGAANNQEGVAGNSAFGTGFNVAQNVAQNGLTGSLIQQQLSPYIQSVVNPILQAQQIQNQQAVSNLRGSEAKNNAFGNNTGAEAAYYAGVQPQQQAQIAGLFNQGYQNAQTTALQSLQAQLAGTGAIGNLSNANTGANTALGNIGQGNWQASLTGNMTPFQLYNQGVQGFTGLGNLAGQNQKYTGNTTGNSTTQGSTTPSWGSIAAGLAGTVLTGMPMGFGKADGGAVTGRGFAGGGSVGGSSFADKVRDAMETMRGLGGRVDRREGFDDGGWVNGTTWRTGNSSDTANSTNQNSFARGVGDLGRQFGPPAQQQQNPGADMLARDQAALGERLRLMLASSQPSIRPTQGMAGGGSPLTDTIAEWGAWPAAMAANRYWNIFGGRNQTPAVTAASQPTPEQQPAPDTPSAPPGHYLSNGIPAYSGPMPPTSGPEGFAAPGSLFAEGLAPRPSSSRGPFAQFDPFGSDPTNPFERPNGAMAATTEDAQRIGLNQGIVGASLMQPQVSPSGLGGPDPSAQPRPSTDPPAPNPPNPYVRAELNKSTQTPPQDRYPSWMPFTTGMWAGEEPSALQNFGAALMRVGNGPFSPMGEHIQQMQAQRLTAARLAEEMRIHNRPTWGVIGHNIDNIPIYGWIDPQNQNATAQPGVGAPPTNAPGQSMLTGQEYLATLDPARAAQLVAIDEGRAPMPPRTPRNQGLLAQLSQYNPALDATLWRARNTTHTGFASGPEARNTAAINMSIQHLLRLNQAINGLDNYSALPGIINPVRNAVRDRTSAEYQAAVDQFRAAAEASATELMRAFRGGSGTGSVSEIEAWGRLLDPNRSPEALRRTVQEGVHLLEGRITSLQNQYNNGMSTSNRPIPLLAPETLQGIEELTRQTSPRRAAVTAPPAAADNTTGTQTPPPAAQTSTPPPNQAGPQPTPADLRQHFMSQPEGPVLLPNGQPAGYIRRGNQLIRTEGALGTPGNPFPATADVTEAGQHAYHNGRLYRRTPNVISPLFQHRWEEVNQDNGG